ncbi:terpenoid synthase [Mycena polygramma]|nr:terpenoid synthase [Mycena polygramma]
MSVSAGATNLRDLFKRISRGDSGHSFDDSEILEPYTYIASNAGKNFRSRLMEGFNEWLKVPAETLNSLASIINMLHTASLMIDDIEDDSQLRRGNPVAHKIYGIPQTINAANYMYFLAFQELSRLPSPTNNLTADDLQPLYDILTSELILLHRGQGIELLWRDSNRCPTEEQYIEMVNNKTGGLLRIGVKLMMAFATQNKTVDYVPLTNMIGVTFQIRDDLLNLQSSVYKVDKGFAEDLTEGKFSFPIIHGIREDQGNRQILNVLQKRPTSPTLKTHAIAYLKSETKSFEYTLSVLNQFHKEILAELERLGGSDKLKVLMEEFHAMTAE